MRERGGGRESVAELFCSSALCAGVSEYTFMRDLNSNGTKKQHRPAVLKKKKKKKKNLYQRTIQRANQA